MTSPILNHCPTCPKKFPTGSESSSYKRHVSYCRRTHARPRARPRSCHACSAAKTRCVSRPRCLRCAAKGLDCVFDGGRRTGETSEGVHYGNAASPEGNSNVAVAGLGIGGVGVDTFSSDAVLWHDDDDGGSSLPTMLRDESFGDADLNALFGGDNVVPLSSGSGSGNKMSLFESWRGPEETQVRGLLSDMDLGLNFLQTMPSLLSSCTQFGDNRVELGPASAISTTRLEQRPPSPLSSPAPGGLLMPLHVSNSAAQLCANLILQSLQSFPFMMTRRETFPPFIHARWGGDGYGSPDPPLPEPIANCISIARMFADNTAHPRAFLWRTVHSEYDWLNSELHNFSRADVWAAMEAQLIYVILRITDTGRTHDSRSAELNRLMAKTYTDSCDHFRATYEGGPTPLTRAEKYDRRQSWEAWLDAESRRRTNCVYFLISRLVCMFIGAPCDTMAAYQNLALPTPQSLWNARSQGAWDAEYARCASEAREDDIITVGQLIEANREQGPGARARLARFNSKLDSCLGMLMNLAVALC